MLQVQRPEFGLQSPKSGWGVGGARHGNTCLKARAEGKDKKIPRAHWPASLDKSASSCPVRDSVSKTRQEPLRWLWGLNVFARQA